jgi:hypothetical protein
MLRLRLSSAARGTGPEAVCVVLAVAGCPMLMMRYRVDGLRGEVHVPEQIVLRHALNNAVAQVIGSDQLVSLLVHDQHADVVGIRQPVGEQLQVFVVDILLERVDGGREHVGFLQTIKIRQKRDLEYPQKRKEQRREQKKVDQHPAPDAQPVERRKDTRKQAPDGGSLTTDAYGRLARGHVTLFQNGTPHPEG